MSDDLPFLRLLGAAAFSLTLGVAACASDDPTPAGCTPGSADGCPSGQVCSAAGSCEATNAVSGALVIESANARACEVLLESSTTEVVRATYADGVSGALRRRPPRVAIAVASETDRAFATDAIRLELAGAAAGVEVVKVDCYDASGAALATASASVR